MDLDQALAARIPAGWRLYTVDASVNGRANVLLKRCDEKWWHGLSEEMRDLVNLYAQGVSSSVGDALNIAARQAAEYDDRRHIVFGRQA